VLKYIPPLARGHLNAFTRVPHGAASLITESEVHFVYAIIETGGKQYKVSGGDIIYVEKLDVPEGDTVIIDKVLAYSDGGVLEVGSPYTEYKCEASVVKNGKGKKLRIIRYKPKKNQKRHMGHRQPYTKLQILTFSK